MRASTFGLDEGKSIEVEILSGPTSTGLFVVTDGKRKMARHRDRLVPLDDEASVSEGGDREIKKRRAPPGGRQLALKARVASS